MMQGRPTMIRNLVPGVPCRIRAFIGEIPTRRAIDDTSVVRLSGRSKYQEVPLGVRHSLIGHLSLCSRTFVVEEIETYRPRTLQHSGNPTRGVLGSVSHVRRPK